MKVVNHIIRPEFGDDNRDRTPTKGRGHLMNKRLKIIKALLIIILKD